MMDRRNFIGKLSQTGILLATHSHWDFFSAKKDHTIGLLLGTVEKYMTDYPDATLKRIAEIGFKELEYPRTYGHAKADLRSIIKKYNLVSLGGGENITNLTNNFAQFADEYQQMNKKYVFCYWPWFDDGKNKTIEDWKKQADVFNELGKKYKAAGLRLGYHNHNIEFIETEGQIPYNILLDYLDPEYTTFQMDIWWVITGGQDPLYFIKNHPGRFEVCHIKLAGILDGTESANEFDYRHIISEYSIAGFKHFILENEPGIKNPFDFFEKSFTYVQYML